ncbi:xylose isomerase-like protein [Testicularia cyperi]|uniref:Xylose isomerase-like protein n=1 Tax=Testicularia cyperi TaxID=1882483 RepID=A0A317Y1Y0_9BASI|nr:xylose isomerase-like protein [Testicularia cyperi]
MLAQQPKYGIFTHSVGYHTQGHCLLDKLRAIADAGIDGVEIFSDDLYEFSKSQTFARLSSGSPQHDSLLTPPDSPLAKHRKLSSSSVASSSSSSSSSPVLESTYNAYGACSTFELDQEIRAAEYVADFCRSLGLEIYNLQPLRDIEGWVDAKDREVAMERVKSRFPVMKALGTELLLICSNNAKAPQTTGDLDTLVKDFTQISDMAYHFAEVEGHNIKVGFEALSWGAHVDVWQQAWEVVRTTDRDNIGLILDSFNTLGRQFADPCTVSGIQEPVAATYAALESNLELLSTSVPASKIFFLQIGDACRMPAPLEPSPNANEPRPARMIWSRSSRLFPCEFDRGAFMPVKDFIAAVAKTGYSGPWSIEVFNNSLDDANPTVPLSHATRARAGLDRLVEQVAAHLDKAAIASH